MIREDFLQQDAFREGDRYTSPQKQAQMLQIILTWYQQGVSSLQNRALWEQLHREEMRTAIAGMKYRPEDQWEEDFTTRKENQA